MQLLILNSVTEVCKREIRPVYIILIVINFGVRMMLELCTLCVKGCAFWDVMQEKGFDLAHMYSREETMKTRRLHVQVAADLNGTTQFFIKNIICLAIILC